MEITDESRELAARIHHDLKSSGANYSTVARSIGISPQAVRAVAFGIRPTKWIREALARAAGKTVADYWPGLKDAKEAVEAL